MKRSNARTSRARISLPSSAANDTAEIHQDVGAIAVRLGERGLAGNGGLETFQRCRALPRTVQRFSQQVV